MLLVVVYHRLLHVYVFELQFTVGLMLLVVVYHRLLHVYVFELQFTVGLMLLVVVYHRLLSDQMDKAQGEWNTINAAHLSFYGRELRIS